MDKPWRVDWDNRMIFISKKITNRDLIGLFGYLTTEEKDKMIQDGPLAEWVIVTGELN